MINYWEHKWRHACALGGGLLIWHIDDHGSQGDTTVPLHHQRDIECADGLWDSTGAWPESADPDPERGRDNLDFWPGEFMIDDSLWVLEHNGNSGDSTDVFFGGNNDWFDGMSNPNSNGYDASGAQTVSSHVAVVDVRRSTEDTTVMIATLLVNNWFGHITQNTTWGPGTYVITGDVTVDPGVTLTILPGTKVKFWPLMDNQCGGVDTNRCELIVEGTLVANGTWDNLICFMPTVEPRDPAAWYGIRFRPNSLGSARYCVIEHGYCGITADGSNLSLIAESSIRYNEFAGILVYECSPSIRNNDIYFNGIYGISTKASNSYIDSNTLDHNLRYGIVSAVSSGWIVSNRITQSEFAPMSTDYGIKLNDAGPDLHLVGNYVSDYYQGGIACSDVGEVEMTEDSVISSGYYGMYCLNSNPVVTQTGIIGHDVGVYCIENSYPTLGWIVGPDTVGGKNSIHDNRKYHVANCNESQIPEDFVKAEVNWWGTSPPDPDKFYGLVDYIPWLEDPPGGGGGAQSAPAASLVPAAHGLSPAFPNPFRSATAIRYQLPKACHVTLKVYDMTGRLVKMLVDDNKKPGYYQIAWEGGEDGSRAKIASGVYFCRMQAGDYKSVKKLIVLR